MSHLSHEMCGTILPHDAYGSHLNSSRQTIDVELELRNFAKAGEDLARIWSNLSIDGYEVFAEYRPPGSEALPPPEQGAQWYADHVRESQYFLQVNHDFLLLRETKSDVFHGLYVRLCAMIFVRFQKTSDFVARTHISSFHCQHFLHEYSMTLVFSFEIIVYRSQSVVTPSVAANGKATSEMSSQRGSCHHPFRCGGTRKGLLFLSLRKSLKKINSSAYQCGRLYAYSQI